jgi:aminoglycoside phosphotransferase (APT) family kinase protein
MASLKFISKEIIEKGWSGDKKYCVTDEQGNKFLLRISPIEQYERKKSEYELMQKVASLGIPMCEPLEFGVSDEGVYSIQTWIEGTVLEDIIETLSPEQQYIYGLEAGKILQAIHKIPVCE